MQNSSKENGCSTARRCKLVAFDMDDTLYAEVDYVRSGFRVVADHIGRAADTATGALFDRMWWHFEHGDRRKVFDAVLAEFCLQQQFRIDDLVELYRTHKPTIVLQPDADAVLSTLRAAGVHLAIVSDGLLIQQTRKADALGLAERVEKIVFTDSLPPGSAKPSEAPFAMLMADFGLEGSRCMYVGDNPAKDFVGPRKLNWLAVQILRENGIYRAESPPDDGRPDVQITDLRDILHKSCAQ